MNKTTKNVFWLGFIIGLGLLGSIDQYLQWQYAIGNPNLNLETTSDKVFNS